MKNSNTSKAIKPTAYEAYANRLASGMAQSTAYRETFPNSRKWTAASVHNKASALARNARVSARVASLQQQSITKTVLSLEARKELLSQIALNKLPPDETVTTRDRLNAVDLLNKLEGVYVERKDVVIRSSPLAFLEDIDKEDATARELLPHEAKRE